MTSWTRPRRVRAGITAACALGALGLAGASPAADPTDYKKPTRVGDGKANTLIGTSKRDVFYAVDGNDRVFGKGGNDILYGGSGHDRIEGNAGRDILEGGSGNDRLNGGSGRDDLDGGSGNDRINARDGVRDLIFCGSGRDSVVADRKDLVRGACETVRRG